MFREPVSQRSSSNPPPFEAPTSVDPSTGMHRTRRVGGARHEVSERVTFVSEGREIPGWTLNISRSGLRAIVEERVESGETFSVAVGDSAPRLGRVVWAQEQPDGAIVGLSFLDGDDPFEAPPGGDA